MAHGELAVEVGIGAHFGEALVGSIGDAQRLDYLVIGDNGQRDEPTGTAHPRDRRQIVVTDELVAQVRTEGAAADGLLHCFTRRGEVRVAGRDRPLTVWTVGRKAPSAAGHALR